LFASPFLFQAKKMVAHPQVHPKDDACGDL